MVHNLPYYMTNQLNLYWSGLNEVIRYIAIPYSIYVYSNS